MRNLPTSKNYALLYMRSMCIEAGSSLSLAGDMHWEKKLSHLLGLSDRDGDDVGVDGLPDIKLHFRKIVL